MMIANDLVEISLRDGEEEVNLRRPGAGAGAFGPVVTATPAMGNPMPMPNPAPAATVPAGQEAAEASAKEPEVALLEIKSPMVGTFYAAPDPDSPPYVSVGAPIDANSVVCIVEAMKVFNEIKAEVTGTIEKILVKNEQPVEFGQPMFLVRPD
jgi:acetyl-CoA carboxylase biotin carboxyl carrier protein